jgi:hypothetical protein
MAGTTFTAGDSVGGPRSYPARVIAEVMDEILRAPGPITFAAPATCAPCVRKNVPGLGEPLT